MISTAELSLILEQTQQVAKEAGAFIRKERQHFDVKNVEHKGFNDLVSYVDKEAEKLIVDQLSVILPQAGFITEEGTNTTKAEEYNWVVDPLDGTTNFIHGVPVYSVSIALMQYDEVLLGVVYEVNLHECFYAMKEGGAYCNDTRIQVSQAENLSAALVATGFPYYDFGLIDKYLAVLKQLMKTTHGVRRFGSAAVDLCYVASGRIEGFFEYNLNSYDVAAGALIVEEAGGKVSDFSNGRNFIFGREILATNSKVHQPLLADIQDIWLGDINPAGNTK